jgi:hypothetical protein
MDKTKIISAIQQMKELLEVGILNEDEYLFMISKITKNIVVVKAKEEKAEKPKTRKISSAPNKSSSWTQEEDNFIIQNYLSMKVHEIAPKLGRSVCATATRVQTL